MINGHSMTEHVYDSNELLWPGFPGWTWISWRESEIIRGPASALYGSNAMLATINVITRSPADESGFHASTETGSFGKKKANFSDSLYLGKGANFLVSGSYFANSGQTLFIPQFDSSATNNGIVRNGDGEQGYHSFANLIWGDWTFTAYFNSRRKRVPVNWADDTVFDDGGSRVRDSRNFVEAARSQDVGGSGKLSYRFYYDDYRYDDRFDYNFGHGVVDQRSLSRNEWLGSEVTYRVADTTRGTLTVGTQGEWELRNLQAEWDVSPALQTVNFNIPDRTIALFVNQEWHFSPRWKTYAGARFDSSHNYGNALSPKLALIFQQSPKTVYKAVYGRPFRNPSAFEKYFDDNETLISNLSLHAEHANTFEATAEHKFSQKLSGILNLYQYRTDDLIDEVFPANGSTPQFQNITRVRSTQELRWNFQQSFLMKWNCCGARRCSKRSMPTAESYCRTLPDILGKLRAGLPVFQPIVSSFHLRCDS